MPWLFSSFQVSALFGVCMQGGEPEWRHGSWRVYFCYFFFLNLFIGGNTCGGQGITGRTRFCLKTTWDPWIELRSPGLAASASTCWATSQAPPFMNELSFSLSLALSGVSSIHIILLSGAQGWGRLQSSSGPALRTLASNTGSQGDLGWCIISYVSSVTLPCSQEGKTVSNPEAGRTWAKESGFCYLNPMSNQNTPTV